jgi:hypothetical protein
MNALDILLEDHLFPKPPEERREGILPLYHIAQLLNDFRVLEVS